MGAPSGAESVSVRSNFSHLSINMDDPLPRGCAMFKLNPVNPVTQGHVPNPDQISRHDPSAQRSPLDLQVTFRKQTEVKNITPTRAVSYLYIGLYTYSTKISKKIQFFYFSTQELLRNQERLPQYQTRHFHFTATRMSLLQHTTLFISNSNPKREYNSYDVFIHTFKRSVLTSCLASKRLRLSSWSYPELL